MEKPNIIFFICHDLGKHLGCYDALVKSPNLDKFAKTGIQFNKTFCNATACSPSRGCLMTGRYSHNNGLIGLSHHGWGLSQDEKTIVDYLNDADYETVHIGHNHERHVGQNHYQIDLEESPENSRTDYVVDDAIKYLKTRINSDKPFYLNLGVNEVHAHHYNERYEDPYGGATDPDQVFVPNYMPSELPMRKMFGRFQAAIEYMDQHVGRLLAEIEALGYLDNSIVIFTTDHGISGSRSKGTLYDRGMEVSYLMHLPNGLRNGYEINHLTQHIDITPTLLEAAGIKISDEIQGKSFWPLLTDNDYQPHNEIYTERNYHIPPEQGQPVEQTYDPQRSIRTDRFHYIRYFKPDFDSRPYLPWESPELIDSSDWGHILPETSIKRDYEELYDLAHDNGEYFNLANNPEYQHIKKELIDKMSKWMNQTNDHALIGTTPLPKSPDGWGYPRDTQELESMKEIAFNCSIPN
ncbi:sulfatase [Planctomycetota bacterium]|nr:sulfatase [Planctomycetota bacterium]